MLFLWAANLNLTLCRSGIIFNQQRQGHCRWSLRQTEHEVMLSSSSGELILNTSQRYGWLQRTTLSEFPLTSFIIFLLTVLAAKKVQAGISSSQQCRKELSQQSLLPDVEKLAATGYTEKEGKKRETWVNLASSYEPLPTECGSQWKRKLIPHAGNLYTIL